MLRIPLEINGARMVRYDTLRQSVDAVVGRLVSSPRGECKADPDYGFTLSALRFGLVDEKEGVVFESDNKKISGISKNLNTYAFDLKRVIETYEPRLEDVNVSMTYRNHERKIYVAVKGTLKDTQEKYNYETVIRVWS